MLCDAPPMLGVRVTREDGGGTKETLAVGVADVETSAVSAKLLADALDEDVTDCSTTASGCRRPKNPPAHPSHPGPV